MVYCVGVLSVGVCWCVVFVLLCAWLRVWFVCLCCWCVMVCLFCCVLCVVLFGVFRVVSVYCVVYWCVCVVW